MHAVLVMCVSDLFAPMFSFPVGTLNLSAAWKITFRKDKRSYYYFRAGIHKQWASGCNPEGRRGSSFADGTFFFSFFLSVLKNRLN